MGVLNVTPDSFSDGGRFVELDRALQQARQMVRDGADIIDVGGETTKPGSDPIPEEVEFARVKPVVEQLLQEAAVPISIDTHKPAVAQQCLELGAHMINDVTGLRNPAMIDVVARHDVPVVIMHMRGVPKTMQEDIVYDDVVAEVREFLEMQARRAEGKGVQQIIIDPGIGFGKTVRHNLQILRRLGEFTDLGYPVLVGPSRKSFIGKLTGTEVDERLEGTLASVTAAVLNGANILRVHDVKACKRAVQVADATRCA